jgi:hypothetical protein
VKELETRAFQREFSGMKNLAASHRRKARPARTEPSPKPVVAKLSKKGGRLVFQLPKGYRLDPEAIAKAVAEERESRA